MPLTHKIKIVIVIAVLCFTTNGFAVQYRDGYYGFGTDTRHIYAGGGDQKLFIVDDLTLNNGTPSDPPSANGSNPTGWNEIKCGSFREAIVYANAQADADGVAIVFDISGNIDSGSTSHISYPLTKSNVLIAGQTAPGDGITFHNATLNVTGSNVIVQHLRIRGGYNATTCSPGGFLVNVPASIPALSHITENVVLEHVSTAWQLDEGIGIGDMSDVTQTVRNVSVLYSITAQGIDCTGTYTSDSKGMLIFRSVNGHVYNITVAKNMIQSNRFRHPNIHATGGIFNNVVFNARDMSIRADESLTSADPLYVTIAYNYNKPGNCSNSLVSSYFSSIGESPTNSEFFIVGNKQDTTAIQQNAEDWTEVNDPDGIESTSQHVVNPPPYTWPMNVEEFIEYDISTMATDVKTYAGARPNSRDGLDAHLIAQYDAGTGISTILTTQPAACGTQPCYETLSSTNHDLDNSPSGQTSIPVAPHTVLLNGRTNFEEWSIGFAEYVETGTFGTAFENANTPIRLDAYPSGMTHPAIRTDGPYSGTVGIPKIYCVNTTTYGTASSDSTRNGLTVKQGGLEAFFNWDQDNKTAIFEVSGTITINARKYLHNNYIHMYGQTAPGNGVQLKGLTIASFGEGNVFQHLRVGANNTSVTEGNQDGINLYGRDSIVDHCTVTWADDENIGNGPLLDTINWTGPDGNGEYTLTVPTRPINIRRSSTYMDEDNGGKGGLSTTEWDWDSGTLYVGWNPVSYSDTQGMFTQNTMISNSIIGEGLEFSNETVRDSGTAGSGTTGTKIYDTFTTDQHNNYTITFTTGPATGQEREIKDTSITYIEVWNTFNPVPVSGNSYTVTQQTRDNSKGVLTQDSRNLMLYKNLLIHNHYRNPWFYSTYGSSINNWVYDPADSSIDAFAEGENPYYGESKENIITLIGNVYQRGPTLSVAVWRYSIDNYLVNRNTKFYFDDIITNGSAGNDSTWDYVYEVTDYANVAALKAVHEIDKPDGAIPLGFTPAAASTVSGSVATNVGAWPNDRSSTETRLVADAVSDNGDDIKSQADLVGGSDPNWPTISALSRNVGTGMGDDFDSIPASLSTDTDSDGRSDFMEWIDDLTIYAETGELPGGGGGPTEPPGTAPGGSYNSEAAPGGYENDATVFGFF